MFTSEERNMMNKLETLKDIRSKTLHLEKIKARILKQISTTNQEHQSLSEYRQEMELLMQEKMAHVEELRQIHADINAMENVMKQAEEAHVKALDTAKRLHEEYLPLKLEIDRMRHECLGLERLPELHEIDSRMFTPEKTAFSFFDKQALKSGWSVDREEPPQMNPVNMMHHVVAPSSYMPPQPPAPPMGPQPPPVNKVQEPRPLLSASAPSFRYSWLPNEAKKCSFQSNLQTFYENLNDTRLRVIPKLSYDCYNSKFIRRNLLWNK
ncbi:Hypothetical predicted protein [Cloeon dipterum]|uniref:Uncharacterized protein n=1 Tax=Cloeon dipterum TaxID=197152 RepID=A0A8S1CEG5_9INSE|nr:Hypothetical predicted protein [Cloeon dipterum]